MIRIFAIVCMIAAAAQADWGWGVKPGRSTFKFLKLPVAAREAGLAGAGLASPDPQAGLADNPLAIGEATMPSIQVGRVWLPSEIGARSADLAMVIPLFDDAGSYGLGLSARYLGWDPLDGRDGDGFATGGFGAEAWSAALGIGRKVGRFSSSVQGRFVQQSISQWLARGFLGDLALSYSLPIAQGELAIAAAGRNWGWVSGYTEDEQEFAPSLLQAGLSWSREWRPSFRTALMTDLRRRTDEQAQPILGGEIEYSLLVFRAGIPIAGDAGGDLSAGLGLRLSEFAVDYAYAGNRNLGGNHHFSLGLKF